MPRLLPVLLALALPAGAKWLRLESGPFDLYSDGGERPARETLERLDLARRVFSGLAPSLRATPLPVRVFVLSEGRFRTVRPGETIRGFYQSAAQRDSIVLPADGSPRVVFHEYVHLVLNHTSGPLPKWLEEGLAEFHSTLEVRAGKVRLGGVVREHLRALAVNPLLSAADMLGVTRQSPLWNQPSHAGIFYAQSWGMVHMLRLHEHYRGGFSAFLAAVERGEAQGAAFQRVFGRSASEAVGDLKAYLERTMLPVVDIAVELDPAGPQAQHTAISEFDGDQAHAELARECGRPQESDRIYARLTRGRPSTPLTEAALGYIALGQDRREEARQRFEKAMELGSRDSAVAFEHAMLVRDSGAPRSQVRSLLERVVTWNPQFAEAQFLLGVEDAHENRHTEAIARLKLALAVLPRQSYFWHALSLSEHSLGNRDAARHAAQRALDSAANAEQVQMARAALTRIEPAERTQAAANGPSVVVPESWRKSEGNQRLEGVLERIDCLGRSARFHIAAPGKRQILWVENPGDILLRNLSSVTFEFRCGPQKPVPVIVEYRAAPDAGKGTAGWLTAIEFP